MDHYPYGKDWVNRPSTQGEDDTVEIRILRPNEAYSRDVGAHSLDADATQRVRVLGKPFAFKG